MQLRHTEAQYLLSVVKNRVLTDKLTPGPHKLIYSNKEPSQLYRSSLIALVLAISSPTVAVANSTVFSTDDHQKQTIANTIKQSVAVFLDRQLPSLLASSNIDSGRTEYTIAALDPRLNLHKCDKALTHSVKNQAINNSRLMIKTRCEGSKPWSIFVPVSLRIFKQVVVATKPLSRGQQIALDDIALQERNIAKLNGHYFLNLNEALGFDVKRPVQAQQTLLNSHVQPPLVVKRGDTIAVEAATSSINVKSQGVALANGRVGEQIAIRNSKSKRVVKATITGPGRANIPM